MSSNITPNYNRFFSHIYVEQAALQYPETQNICQHFQSAKIIEIDSYQELFNRHQQNWEIQKNSQKLILAVRKDNFLYSGSTSVTPNFGHINYFYNALVLNCLYDCEYCYLQGMFASAHTVAFVNLDQYFEHTEAKLNELGDMYLCISYDSDLLAFEHFLGYVRKWIEFAQKHPTLTLEIRSKSANFKSINDLKPVNNVILAWTLSPEIISQKYEHKAPSLNARIKSMQEAVNSGWCVRLCLDPLILVPDWQDHYSELITRLASSIELSKLSNIYLGAFRLNNSHYLAIKNKRKKSALFNGNVNYIIKDQILSYSELEQESVKSFVTNKLITAGALDEQISWI